MKVSIIILNYNGQKDTLECLESVNQVRRFKGLKVNIIVVDNNSSDGSVKAIRNKFPQIKVIQNQKNLGFAQGNNIGIRYALKNNTDYIMLLNNDTLVEKNFLVQLIKAMEKDNEIGIISPKIYFAPGFEFHKDRYKNKDKGRVIWYAGGLLDWQNILASHLGVDEIDNGQYNKITETSFVTGCCMLIKREVFNKIGLFNPKYFLYWEDIDLCFRAKKAGFKIFYAPQAKIWHKNASSSGGAGQKTSVYYQTRNRLLFTFKYASLKTKLAILKESIRKLFKASSLEKKAIKDFFLFNFGKMKR